MKMRQVKYPRETAIFFFIAMTLMIVVKLFIMGDYKYWDDLPSTKGNAVIVDEKFLYDSENQDYAAANTGDLPHSDPYIDPDIGGQSLPAEGWPQDILPAAGIEGKDKPKTNKPVIANTPPATKIPPIQFTGTPRVVIIIDDMGLSRDRSLAAIDLPAPITFAFLPYAPRLPEITKHTLEKGHELLIHVPMEPMKSTLDPGPIALTAGMSREAFDLNLQKIFESFDGYVGINNHMGSKLTQRGEEMSWVMEALAKRDLMFIDSKTIHTSVAAQTAASYGLRYAERDVFLDHENTPEFVMAALQKLENIARRRGVAIAIGHPKDATIEGLKKWIPTLKEKGIELVPVSAVVHRAIENNGNARIAETAKPKLSTQGPNPPPRQSSAPPQETTPATY